MVDLRKEEVNILPVTIHFKNLKFDFLILSLIFLEWCFSVISVVPVTAVLVNDYSPSKEAFSHFDNVA